VTKGITTQKGLTLLEILISLVVLSVGLLGIAGMQATGLRNNHAAYTKTQATALAMDMADRIRANPQGAADYNNFDTSGTIPADPGCISSAAGCTAARVAQFDKYQWSQPLISDTAPVLPDGRGKINYDPDTNKFTITLLWLEPNYQGVTHTNCITGQGDLACMQMTFQP
jgi:type IV pilus assembly protein PilV